MENINLTNEQLDALRELGHIGGGNAGTALNQLLGKKVTVNIPHIDAFSMNKVSGSEFLIKPEELGIVISSQILGKLKGGMLILYPQKSALAMIDILTRRKIGTTQILTLMDESAISESSHIIFCSYLNAVGEILRLYQLIPSITQVAVGRIGSVTKTIVEKFIEQDANYILPIENLLIIEDIKVNLYVVFLLEQASLKKILDIVGL